MDKERSLEEIRKKAHSINCQLYEEGFTPREIEILGYYLGRIAASYLSFFTHQEYEKTFSEETEKEKKQAPHYGNIYER